MLLSFGSIEIEGRRYDHDVVIDRGEVRKRSKKPSKSHQAGYGHTPLSAGEDIPWGGDQLIIGTGVDGALPVMAEVLAEARHLGIDVVAVPTAEACRLLAPLAARGVRAILHVTC